jgi:hypothetical protein
MTPMFTFTLPRLSDHFPKYPNPATRVRMVEGAGAAIGVFGLLFMVGVVPLWLPVVIWMIVASLDLTTMEWAPESGRIGLKAFALLFADLCMFATFSKEYSYPPQIIAGPLFAASIWLMTRHQPDKETA